MSEIKDLLYLDIDKVTSLYSQISGGIVQSTEISSSKTKNDKNLRNYDFKVFKHEAGGTQTDAHDLKEIRVSHHDIYNNLEFELFKQGYTSEMGVDILEEQVESGEAVQLFENSLCVKAEGYVVLEDYKRITRIANNYEDISNFINKSVLSSLNDNADYQKLIAQIDELKGELKRLKNGVLKSQKKSEIAEFETKLDCVISNAQIGRVDDWIIEGLQTWVSVFLPNIFNIRLYPFEASEKFHVMANLNREYFLDDDTEIVHYLYGSKPTIKLTMLGVITSIPKKNGETFDPMKEFNGESNEAVAVEGGFRGVFRGFDGLEDMIRTCRYPRIMVQPLAIFRSVKQNESLKRDFS